MGEIFTSVFKTLVLFSIFCVVIVWAVRPDMIDKAKAEITAPYNSYIADKNEKIWKLEKENQYYQWIASHPLPVKCNAPKTGLSDLECKNLQQERMKTFNLVWLTNIQNGWKPSGLQD